MAAITSTITFADGDQVTSAKLNEILSGSSFVAGAITGTTLVITGGALKVGTITSSEMGALSIATGSLIDASVTTAKLADGSITTAKLANLAVTGAKIAAETITFSNLSTAAVAAQSAMQSESASQLVAAATAKYSPAAAKGYGEFLITGTGRTIRANSRNISGLTRIDSTNTTVNLGANMDSEFYTVVASLVSTGTPIEGSVTVYDKAAGSFKLLHPAEGSGRSVNFVIFGKLA
jgi:hypothetical protein